MANYIDDLLGGQFELVDESLFEQISFGVDKTENVNEQLDNYCVECKIPMTLAGIEYHCAECGRIQETIVDNATVDHGETVSGAIRIGAGANKGRFYNLTVDYAKTQKKVIVEQLNQNQLNYTGMTIPSNVLNAVANQYNSIQKYVTEDDYDENGNVRGQRKFVRRGNIKDEVLAALIYFECIRENLIRKKRDISEFMKLPAHGFSRGEDIVRQLAADGKLDIVTDETVQGYLERYLCALNIENERYMKFVIDLVEMSERKRICMSSQLSSKVVGSLHILVTKLGLKISNEQFDRACDNCKRNTYMKFVKEVYARIDLFKNVFIKHRIPYK